MHLYRIYIIHAALFMDMGTKLDFEQFPFYYFLLPIEKENWGNPKFITWNRFSKLLSAVNLFKTNILLQQKSHL